MQKKIKDVFGVKNEVLPDSYVDRGALDEQLAELINDGHLHVALRGASKCGKSWLRRKILHNPVVVQCRLHKLCIDLYTDALSQLDIEFKVESRMAREVKGTVKATGELGLKILSKAGLETSAEWKNAKEDKYAPVGRDINDLRYIADILKASGRKLVIEDFHYLAVSQRAMFAFDLKAFWDWGVQVIIVGVWSVDNMLLTLNPDLTGRIKEITIAWNPADLGQILDKGGSALNFRFAEPLRSKLITAAYGNAGQLQTLVVEAFANQKITQSAPSFNVLSDGEIATNAAMEYAEQLNPLYQEFARRVAKGIRKRTRSTNIYAHAMAVIMSAPDASLINGFGINEIFEQAKAREPRILLGNLKSILSKIELLQVDSEGRGLVLAYSDSRGISVVDRQLLLYRKYSTVSWPWEEIIEASAGAPSLEADDDSNTDEEVGDVSH